MLVWVLAAGLGGCGPDRGDKPVLGAEQLYLDAADQVLPVAVVGLAYDAPLLVTGGEPPYLWSAPEGTGVPTGLALRPDGHLVGVPAEAGTFLFSALIADSAGRSKRIEVTVEVILEPQVVTCGETVSGSFAGTAVGFEGPDLTAQESLAWLAVALPETLTTRVELGFDARAVATLYVERAAEPIGSSDIDEHYVSFYLNPGLTDMVVTLDAGTNPSLTPYLAQGLVPLLLVGQSPGDWEMTVTCSDGPIFVTTAQYPTRLGDPLDVDFDVYGDNTGVRIWTEDPLPDWMLWDEATGRVEGTAEEQGAWEFTVIAETEDGRRREERSILGVYDVVDLACDTTTPLSTDEGYFDGDFYSYFDPRGYGVFRLPLDGIAPSAITLRTSGADAHYIGLADPDPGWLRFYGGAERVYVNLPEASLEVSPRSYPATDHYLAANELYFSAASIGLDLSLDVSVDCDPAPRPDLAALPVIPALGGGSFPLAGLGGTPPYTWSATGLPNGVALDAGGLLHGAAVAGTYPVEVTIRDSAGGSSTEAYPLYVGTDAACAGYTPIRCGDAVEGTYTESYFNDDNGSRSTTVFCLVDQTEEGLGFEVYSDDGELRVDVADPGRSAREMFDQGYGTYVAWVGRDGTEGVPVDRFSWPNLADYDQLPVLVAVRAYDPGDWAVHLVCQ
ncbi:MAG: putative Ig domain-containing protein [Myxococcota bacterium]